MSTFVLVRQSPIKVLQHIIINDLRSITTDATQHIMHTAQTRHSNLT